MARPYRRSPGRSYPGGGGGTIGGGPLHPLGGAAVVTAGHGRSGAGARAAASSRRDRLRVTASIVVAMIDATTPTPKARAALNALRRSGRKGLRDTTSWASN